MKTLIQYADQRGLRVCVVFNKQVIFMESANAAFNVADCVEYRSIPGFDLELLQHKFPATWKKKVQEAIETLSNLKQ